jgi:hypothetical protein
MSLEYFERTDELSGQAYSIAGTSGFAYSGGAHSGPQSVSKSCNQDCIISRGLLVIVGLLTDPSAGVALILLFSFITCIRT